MKHGDLVSRKSHGRDIIFRIQTIQEQTVIIRGVEYRLLADAPLSDLEAIASATTGQRTELDVSQTYQSTRLSNHMRMERIRKYSSYLEHQRTSFFEAPGKVLHIDGDPDYLLKCMELYERLRVPARGFYIPEPQMRDALIELLPRYKPNILVLTGHDGMIKAQTRRDLYLLDNYKNSFYFVQAVQLARQYERHLDMLTIIAGACQSHFEALLAAGANFASSPGRVFIHALDPLCIATKLAYTSVKDTLTILDMKDLLLTGIQGLGGLESRGSCRLGIPDFRHEYA